MISTRYALPVIFLLLLVLIPTVIHSYLGLTQDYGIAVNNINSVLGDFNSKPTKRNTGWGKETFDSYDWVERVYENAQGKPIRLFVAKSYDHKKLYHHPELALSYGKDLSNNGNILLTDSINIPVHLLKYNNRPGVVAYALLYDGQFIDNPIYHLIKNLLHLLVNARKPIILFYVSDDGQSNDVLFSKTYAAEILNKSIMDFINKK